MTDSSPSRTSNSVLTFHRDFNNCKTLSPVISYTCWISSRQFIPAFQRETSGIKRDLDTASIYTAIFCLLQISAAKWRRWMRFISLHSEFCVKASCFCKLRVKTVEDSLMWIVNGRCECFFHVFSWMEFATTNNLLPLGHIRSPPALNLGVSFRRFQRHMRASPHSRDPVPNLPIWQTLLKRFHWQIFSWCPWKHRRRVITVV